MAFALEQAVDEAAIRMKVDPIALRKRWDPNPNRQRLYDWAAGARRLAQQEHRAAQTGRYRRGVGVASGYWLYIWQPGSKVEVAVKGGRLIASTSTQDIGQGSRTVIANTVARGIRARAARGRGADRRFRSAGGTGRGRQPHHGIGGSADAAGGAKTKGRDPAERKTPAGAGLERAVARTARGLARSFRLGVRPEDCKPTSPGIRSPLREAGFIGIIFGWMMRRFSNLAIGAGVPSSVQVIEVEVDTWLGHVRVLNVHTGIAVGKIAAPALAHSQAAGSVIQGVGYALYEARETDPRAATSCPAGMEDYRIPGIADTPVIDVHFDEGGFDHVMGGSVGIGEVATVPTSPAIANAICHAIGVRPMETPIRPDRLIAALKGRDAA